ncbi:fibronectin type 3 and ankyrin repeat domains protein 1 [Halyomorpha halys]|uniref:fibronectin type 3 and ankyrin repeat domains protein 1 n=1 Tax=Halyomorpha halys TaxID=286706 RepID=UPI000D0C7B8E|nr:fibronectin type 3 and ankyrin repeat domains protein 1-like [Halyomorpha halys]
MEILMKPKLHYVRSTLHSIFLRWDTDKQTTDPIYRIEMKDNTYVWITKYWGMKTHCEIKGLGPETLYYFRLGVSFESDGDEVQSDILVTATNVGPPILFYLFKSAERGDVQGLKDFLSERKDLAALDAFDKKGETALIKGVKKGSQDIVKTLLLAGADVNQGALGSQRTPLMYACFLGDLELATILIENGANVNSIDNNKCGPLHYAVDYSHLELVKLCLAMGSGINMKDAAGWTPLTRAVVLNSSVEVIEELLSNKADIFTEDKNGKTALSLAKLGGNKCFIYILSNYEDKMKKAKEKIENHADMSNSIQCGERIIEEGTSMIQKEKAA